VTPVQQNVTEIMAEHGLLIMLHIEGSRKVAGLQNYRPVHMRTLNCLVRDGIVEAKDLDLIGEPMTYELIKNPTFRQPVEGIEYAVTA